MSNLFFFGIPSAVVILVRFALEAVSLELKFLKWIPSLAGRDIDRIILLSVVSFTLFLGVAVFLLELLELLLLLDGPFLFFCEEAPEAGCKNFSIVARGRVLALLYFNTHSSKTESFSVD